MKKFSILAALVVAAIISSCGNGTPKADLKEELDTLSYAAGIHPYDLSGGEMQLAALAKVLASKPRLLLLDEPTKGLDSQAKRTVCEVLKSLKNQGLTIIAVTHDIEFAALCADRVAMFFRGAVTAVDEPHEFFAENIFYTTSINRIVSPFNPYIITLDDAEKCLGGA